MTKTITREIANGRFNHGFTLIELLVVISIIGIMSTVVLASLNSARSKGADAAVKSNLNNMRGQAELYYSNNGESYGTFAAATCPTPAAPSASNMFDNSTNAIVILKAIAAALAQGANGTRCSSVAGSYAIAVGLKSAGSWCIDSTGKSQFFNGTPTAAITANACN